MARQILIVDDTATVRMVERSILNASGYAIREARDGRQALREVAEEPPDLVLLDIMMPELDGIETCRALKEDAATRGIPVVMVTTKSEGEMLERAFEAGCDDYVTKPLDKLELLTKIHTYLGPAGPTEGP